MLNPLRPQVHKHNAFNQYAVANVRPKTLRDQRAPSNANKNQPQPCMELQMLQETLKLHESSRDMFCSGGTFVMVE